MGKRLEVRMAKASPDDLRMVREFFDMIEEVLKYGTFTETDDGESAPVDDKKLVAMIRERWRRRAPGVGSSWGRVVWGCEILIDNCCDPDADTLEWKPEIQKAMELANQGESDG